MENQNKLKSLEFKIRTYNSKEDQERQDQRNSPVVRFNRETMDEMGLQSGWPFYMWKIDDGISQRREGIVQSTHQNINKNVIQMYKTFQEACGFKYEDRIAVAPAPILQFARYVVLRDVTDAPPLSLRDKPHWEWGLEDKLGVYYFSSISFI